MMNKHPQYPLILLSALLVLASCGSEPAVQPEETEAASDSEIQTTEAETEDLLKPDLPDMDYDGYTFTIYGRGDMLHYLYSDAATGDILADAVYKRNLDVSERYNVKFEYLCSESDPNGERAKNAILADEDAYDLVCPHARFGFALYILEGLAYDWNDLRYVDLGKPYWNKSAQENFTVKGQLYGMVGDIDYGAIDRHIAMFFNKNLAEEYDVESPYTLVKEGRWTLDTFGQMIASVKKDINGDSVMELGTDLFGYVTSTWVGPSNLIYASGQHIARVNENGEIYLTLNTQRTVDMYDKYFSFFDGDYANLKEGAAEATSENLEAFKNNKAFIFDSTMDNITRLRSMDIDFGIIPWPKFDEEQESYSTCIGAACDLLIVPVSSSDFDRTSLILEAMCYEGHRTIIPAYYDISLQTKIVRDDESAEMLDIIFSSGFFDIGSITDKDSRHFGSIGMNMISAPDHNFSSFYAKNEKSANKDLEKINKAFAELGS